MIRLRGVRVDHGDVVAPDGLDLDLPAGSLTALTGPNGAGKTTVARVLLGLTRPTGGTVSGLGGLRRAAVFQEDRLCGHLDAVANLRLALPRGTTPDEALDELAGAGLDEAASRRAVRELSGGQRRRVALARALAARADLVVLDEPFTGLDVQGRPQLLGLVARRAPGRTVLLVTHDLAEAEAVGADTVVHLPPPGANPG